MGGTVRKAYIYTADRVAGSKEFTHHISVEDFNVAPRQVKSEKQYLY